MVSLPNGFLIRTPCCRRRSAARDSRLGASPRPLSRPAVAMKPSGRRPGESAQAAANKNKANGETGAEIDPPDIDGIPQFAVDLRRRLEKSHESVRAIARRAGYSPSTVAAVVDGRRSPGPELLSALLGAVGASGGAARSSSWLIGWYQWRPPSMGGHMRLQPRQFRATAVFTPSSTSRPLPGCCSSCVARDRQIRYAWSLPRGSEPLEPSPSASTEDPQEPQSTVPAASDTTSVPQGTPGPRKPA